MTMSETARKAGQGSICEERHCINGVFRSAVSINMFQADAFRGLNGLAGHGQYRRMPENLKIREEQNIITRNVKDFLQSRKVLAFGSFSFLL